MKKVDPIRTKNKVQEMQETLEEKNIRDALLFRLGIVTMLRISDLIKLQYRDIFTADGEFRTHWTLKEQKTGKTKRVKLDSDTRDFIRSYCERFKLEGEDYLFFSMSSPEKHISRQQAWRRLKPVAQQLNIPNFGMHSLRKTIPYQAWKQHRNIRLCQKMLNHNSPQVTYEYLGLEQDDTDDHVEQHASKLFT